MTTPWFELDDKVLDSRHIAVALIDLAKNRGVDLDRLLRGTGIFYQDLHKAEYRISSSQFYRLIANISKHKETHDLSFLAGRRMFPGHLGPVAQLLSNAKNLADMLRIALCYQQQLFPLMYFDIERHEESSYLLFNASVAENEQYKFSIELFCAAINSVCKWRFGRQLPLHFHFNFPRPRNIYQYEENLGHRLSFDQHLNMVRVDNNWLSEPLTDSSSVLRAQSLQACKKLRQGMPPTKGFLQYTAGYLASQQSASLDQLADHMSLSTSTLKRKFTQHQASFQKIQDNVRCQEAVFALHVRGETNEVAAKRLNFSDLTNFRRSFKRWTGLTPSDIRQAKA